MRGTDTARQEMGTPPPTDAAVWAPFQEAAARVLRPLQRHDGLPEGQLASAEQRLGLRLPRRLRDYYLLAGAWERLNREFNRLRAPEQLVVQGQALVFYEENQGVCVWGILLEAVGLDDPPVVRADNDNALAWEPDHPRVSDFLTTMAYWNAVNGAAAHVGVGSPGPQTVDRLARSWSPIPLAATTGAWDVRLFGRAHQVVCLVGDSGPVVQAAATTAEGLLAIEHDLEIEWDYATLDDTFDDA
jgi:hypothetical protein